MSMIVERPLTSDPAARLGRDELGQSTNCENDNQTTGVCSPARKIKECTLDNQQYTSAYQQCVKVIIIMQSIA